MSDKSAKVAVDTINTEAKVKKGKSLDDDVQVYVPELDDEESVSTFEDIIAENKKKAAVHAKKVRGRSVDEIFKSRMRLPGGTSPVEAGAAVVLLKEDVDGKMTKDKRRERNGVWTQKFLGWIKQYGEEIRSGGGALIGRGDRIEILANGHYRFKW